MGFLSPWWLLAGAAAAALPLWLHLLQAHKQEPFPFPSTMFFERRTESTTFQRRLKYRLLMALRLLLLLLLAFAFAQPFLNRPPAILNAANSLSIIVVDNSFSMREGNRLASAKQQAASAIPLGGQAQIWSLGSRIVTLSPITNDRAELSGAINSIGPSDEKSSFAELARSLRDTARSTGRALKIQFFTDAQRTALPPSFNDLVLEPGSELKVIDVARKIPNYVVESVNAPRTVSDLAKTKINATVTAFNAPAAKRSVALKINGKIVQTKPIDIPENGRATVEFTGLEGPYGWLRGEVAITDPDALLEDNTFFFTVERADPRRVLYIDETRNNRAALYFKTALESSAQAFFVLDEKGPRESEALNFSNYAFVVLNDPGQGFLALEPKLKAYVESGGALFITTGAQSASLRSLPVAGLKTDGTRFASKGSVRFFAAANVDPTFPSLRRTGRFEGVRFFQAVNIEAPKGTFVAARLDDGAPLLIEKKVGEGRVLIFASTFDNVTNDLPVKPSFVPFIEQTAAYLGRVEERISNYPVDSYLDLRSAESNESKRAASVEVIGPKGERALSLKESASASSLRLAESGFYDVRRENGRQELIPVNVDRRESDLDPVSRENLTLWEQTGKGAANTAGANGNITDAPAPSQQGFWWWVALIAMLILVAESFLSSRYLEARA